VQWLSRTASLESEEHPSISNLLTTLNTFADGQPPSFHLPSFIIIFVKDRGIGSFKWPWCELRHRHPFSQVSAWLRHSWLHLWPPNNCHNYPFAFAYPIMREMKDYAIWMAIMCEFF
jgi:hypothetical protein